MLLRFTCTNKHQTYKTSLSLRAAEVWFEIKIEFCQGSGKKGGITENVHNGLDITVTVPGDITG